MKGVIGCEMMRKPFKDYNAIVGLVKWQEWQNLSGAVYIRAGVGAARWRNPGGRARKNGSR